MSHINFYAGIDPGLTGALAVLVSHDPFGDRLPVPDIWTVDNFPVFSTKTTTGKTRNELDLAGTHQLFERVSPGNGRQVLCAIERVGAMPGQGVTSMFRFGQAYGQVHALAVSVDWAIRHTSPGEWKSGLRLGGGKDDARKRAMEIWPAHAKLFARAKDDGRADAALIAYWLWLQSTKIYVRNQNAKRSP